MRLSFVCGDIMQAWLCKVVRLPRLREDSCVDAFFNCSLARDRLNADIRKELRGHVFAVTRTVDAAEALESRETEDRLSFIILSPQSAVDATRAGECCRCLSRLPVCDVATHWLNVCPAVISHSYYGWECQRRCAFEADEDVVAAAMMRELVVNTPRRCVGYRREDVLADERLYVEHSVARRRFLYNVLWSDARSDLSSSQGRPCLFAGVTVEMKDALCELLQQLEHAEVVVDECAPHDRSMDLVHFPYLRFGSRDGVRGCADKVGVLREDVDATAVGPVIRREMLVRCCPPDVFSRLVVRLCRMGGRTTASRLVTSGVSLTCRLQSIAHAAVFEHVDVLVSHPQSADGSVSAQHVAAAGSAEATARFRVSAMSSILVVIVAWHSGAHASPAEARRVCCGGSCGNEGEPWYLFRRVLETWDDVLQGA